MISLKRLIQEWMGQGWSSCRQWASQRSQFESGEIGAKIKLVKTASRFTLMYAGPATGISIAHAKGSSGDTLHQLFNVLICEMNPWLAANKVKPQIYKATSSCRKNTDGSYHMVIEMPCVPSDKYWQINHRGGWGHDPGAKSVIAASNDNEGLEGPSTIVVAIPGNGVITTHFARFPLQ
jgi:hypothetical protein